MTRQQEYFIESCFINDIQMVKTLVKNKVNVSGQNYWGHRICATRGFLELLTFLYQVDSNHKEISKSGILAWAAASQQYDVVKLIISSSDEYKNSSSALQWVAAKGDVEMMIMLITYCEKLDWIFVSAARNGHVPMIEFLLDNGIENLDSQFNLTFNNAILSYKKKVADLLLNRGVVVESQIEKDIWRMY